MTSDFSDFAARLRQFIHRTGRASWNGQSAEPPGPSNADQYESPFNELAVELFRLQFARNPAYRQFCQARGVLPSCITSWTQIPAVPTTAFKEFTLSCLPEAGRTTVFDSSGTTGQQPSRHFHNAASLSIYEASLWLWFREHVLAKPAEADAWQLACLTPPPAQAPHSSLVHMFETIRRNLRSPDSVFVGRSGSDGTWTLDWDAASRLLRTACSSRQPALLLGTAFSFVHLLDALVERDLHLQLPHGSRVMETGGYKGRSRSLPKPELHALITQRLGIPPTHIVCEYGMSELSSQAYDRVVGDKWQVASDKDGPLDSPKNARRFHFPLWARVRIVSPETGCEVAEGEPGLIRVVDLANTFSVMAVQTEDLGVRRGDGFELVGRAALAEARGCSLLPA